MMFATLRAKYGFCGEVSQRASASRRLSPLMSGIVAAEELRAHGGVGDRMLHLAVVAVEDDGLARVVARLAADLREERGEAVVVVECPAVERVVVALRALDAHPHEDLRRVLGHLQRVRLDLVVGGGRIAEGAARGREQALHDAVQRRVGQHLVPQPFEVEQRALGIDHVLARADFEQLGPLHHPQVGEFLAAQQPVHQPVALGGVPVFDEGAGFLRRRQRAGEVQVGAANERGVVADRGRAPGAAS